MPIYEYRCESCGLEFERIQKVSDSAPPCPACHASVKRKVSLSSFQFNGTGFYTTDYNRKSAPSESAGDSSGGGSSAGGDASGTAKAAPAAPASSGGTPSGTA
jgi:putative FmdB family regulatory protein